jgi:uncharacterized protein (TIGR03083 family)
MTREEFLRCLDSDFRLLRGAASDLTAPVPSCPGWSVADLVTHVANVYLHKVECMRDPDFPDDWQPRKTDDPLALLDEAYATLTSEFAARADSDRAASWYDRDKTVGFWVRRMAQETVIHRVDAELAARTAVSPISAELAADGIDEILVIFLAWGTERWGKYFGELLTADGDLSVLVSAGGARWLVRLEEGVVRIAQATEGQAVAQVSGASQDVLLWLWRRVDDSAVRVDGDEAAITRLRGLLKTATQ